MESPLSAMRRHLNEPTARGVANAVSRAIRDGSLDIGAKLPPIRTVARELQLSPTTVSAGWSLLARSGAIRTDGRRGTTVAETRPDSVRYQRAMERQLSFRLDLSTGTPDPELLPDLSQSLKDLTTAGTPSSYLDEPVLPALVEVLRSDWPYVAEEFAIVDGAMDALDLIIRSHLRFGDRIVVEHPTFPLLLDLLEVSGAEVIGVPVDEEGMRPSALRAALKQTCSAIILQPRAQNPTGASLTQDRARELAGIIAPTEAVVIEDDSAGSISTAAPISLGRWLPDQVLHIRSFSKSHGPDLRLAAVSGSAELLGPINARRQLGQGWSSRLLQRILLGLLTVPDAVAQVDHARQEYQRRREAVVQALAERGVHVDSSDGINIWVPVLDEAAAIVRLASQGIGVTPGTPFAVLPDQEGRIRVTVGLLADRHAEIAEQIALAARTGGWGAGR
ncbi:PLP-dependent aminotransferase family protein [uncultured Kocuria sp.]|uniref:aminotransferase-like domain-containing protein n=1 Tax=uncultured Kocuria sp. TaxID=259305 RepID=UPI0026342F98|nr:aminotransferase class I/II-fold pyridoxal phosphate-dependent enzyme [uncultured Kocuria sp.]